MIQTIGEPYRQFLIKADAQGFDIMEGSTKLRAQLEYSMQDIDNPHRRTQKVGFFDWADMEIEELVEAKKQDKIQTVLDSLPKSMRVPHKYAVSFWPSLCMGIVATLHALVILLQYWSVTFNIWINYQPVNVTQVSLPTGLVDTVPDLEEDTDHKNSTSSNHDGGTLHSIPDRVLVDPPSYLPTHARITPGRGKVRKHYDKHRDNNDAEEGSSPRHDVLVPVQYYPTLGITFEYHRRRYVYRPESPSTDDTVLGDGTWSKIRCRTDFDMTILHKTYAGLSSPQSIVKSQIRHGPNLFSVKQPQFLELYKKQLLNPFSVFQIFCVLLWAIDDYLIYSFFSLFMVLTFEATVVFQRLKSLQALRGMGNPSRLVYVFRSRAWQQVDTTHVLPGDILSLTRVKPHHTKESKIKIEDDGGDIVPADVLLLRGSTVVNEASLTGESVPQMKEGVVLDENDDEENRLDMKNRHKMNVAYAGTKMLQCKGSADDGAVSHHQWYSQIPDPPDQGCVCFVLRTGFASAQGKLVRMIEGSQEKTKGHEKETGLLLLLLCVFAILSSSYVLYHGAQDENRSKYELLLHCILIVTNVIRPELPMQMALAVNQSLMTLMRLHVFCTEPYRVPMAGKLDACLFDKTGTLTTDELVAAGVCGPDKLSTKQVSKADSKDPSAGLLTPMTKVSGEAALVLAGCHSLVLVQGEGDESETTGDPLELASLLSMRWHLDSDGHAVPAPDTEKRPGGKAIAMAGRSSVSKVEILTRHHFSSKLQRMSCVIQTGGASKDKFVVAKGSPEAIGRLLANKPEGYDEKSQTLSKQGYRVIGLAYKKLESDAAVESATEHRSSCEENLTFAGFIAFTCMVRKDTADVLKRLRQGGMSIAMVTGDALLTAIHVAREVEIFEALGGSSTLDEEEEKKKEEEESNPELKALLQSKRRTTNSKMPNDDSSPTEKSPEEEKSFRPVLYLDIDKNGSLFWARYEDGSRAEPFVAKDVPELSTRFDLATTGKCLAEAYEQDDDTSKVLQHIKVFARMTPDAKETVIESLHSVNALCLMCGDGANDVGALKQADVGVALLSGFGNINVDKDSGDEKKEEEEKTQPGLTAIVSQEHINEIRALPVSLIKMKCRSIGVDPSKYPDLVEKEDLVQLYLIKAREVAVKRHDQKNKRDKSKMSKAELAAERKREAAEKQRIIQEKVLRRTQELEAQGVSFASFKAMKEVMSQEMQEAKKKKGEMIKAGSVEGSAASLAAQFEDMDTGDLPMVKLGDASIAAPFTSKMPSIKNCVDIVRQGRCTLVSSIQMVSLFDFVLSGLVFSHLTFVSFFRLQYQIMALQCLISSYSLSVLYLDGVKYGDTQMTAMGLLGSVSFMSVSRSKPLDRLSKVRPLTSIFHPALFLSLLTQFAVHLTTMVLAVMAAKKHLPPDFDADLDGSFKPGILNTVVFLVSSVQQVTVFVVNLRGRPFMTGLSQNRPLLWSLAATFILTFMFASETVPGLNRYFQLVPFPEDSFRDYILILLVADLVITFALDRLMQFLFCRDILMAGIKGTTMKDIFGMIRTFVVIGVIMQIFLGNSDTWDELIAMEANLTANFTDTLEDSAEAVADAGSPCVGDLCDAINESVNSLADEF